MPKTLGLRHIAIKVNSLNASRAFYCDILGMTVELETDDYLYLTFGPDNLSLHEDRTVDSNAPQRLEHFGYACASAGDVDEWYKLCKEAGCNIHSEPVTFGIGTHAFSVYDPSDNEVEFTYHPPMCK